MDTTSSSTATGATTSPQSSNTISNSTQMFESSCPVADGHEAALRAPRVTGGSITRLEPYLLVHTAPPRSTPPTMQQLLEK
jgi:hypothetical protein